MDKPDGLGLSARFPVGQVVLSIQGRDRGRFYVVAGLLEGGRLALADAGKFNVSRPKRKNPRHVQRTQLRATELAEIIGAGGDIDRGRFHELLGLRNAPGNQDRRDREAG